MMAKLVFIFIVISFINLAYSYSQFSPYPYYPPSKRQIFGELSTTRIGYQHEHRFGFPFFTREAMIIFPSEYTTDSPYDRFYFIRGILHENELDDSDCIPQLDIVEGGIYDRNATLKITSQSGCGINSKISFYGEEVWRN